MLGDNIKTLRKRKGYSQETLAEQIQDYFTDRGGTYRVVDVENLSSYE